VESRYNENTFEIESGFVHYTFTKFADGSLEIRTERKTDLRWNSVIVERAVSHRLMRWLDGDA
jgi:hypothetical protein